LINAVSSHSVRNWSAAGYAAVADHAQQALGWRVALTGGPSKSERQLGDAIRAHMHSTPVDLIGRDTLKRALALYRRAAAVLSPDAGPMHMANAVGTPVIGLHAASNPARSGPYSDRRWCVDRYAAAAHKFLGRAVEDLPWGTKIERPGVMDLIQVEDVIERLEALDQARRHGLLRH
jgi:heptosyltransferase I